MTQNKEWSAMQIGKYILWVATLAMAVWMFNILVDKIDTLTYYFQLFLKFKGIL